MNVPSYRNRERLSRSILLKDLGVLHVLPYEIRQSIFMIALEIYIDKVNSQRKQLHTGKGPLYKRGGHLDISKLEYSPEGSHCSCLRGSNLQFGDVFALASYCERPQWLGETPLHLRFASPSIGLEFDRIFLARSTFVFVCHNTMKEFLNKLRPFQQKMLRFLRLNMFEFLDCRMNERGDWMEACCFLPPQLSSVEIVLPEHLESIYDLWGNDLDFQRVKESRTFRYAAEVLKELCEEVL